MRRILKLHDSKGSSIFTPWQKFDHPQLGQVEIGGLMTGNARFMYPSDMDIVGPKVTSFIIRHSSLHPEIIITNIKKDVISENVFRIRATLANVGHLSTNVMVGGGSTETKLPVKAKILSKDNMEVLSRNSMFEFNNIGALGHKAELEWFIKANDTSNIYIEVYHPRAGRVM
jgi:hypothetical protein